MKKKRLLVINLMIIFSTMNVFADTNNEGLCATLFAGGLMDKINDNILIPLRVITPILLLVLTTLDFAKVVFSDNKDGMSKATKNFGKRAVATILIFFASNIIKILYGFIQGVGICW